MTRKDLQEIMDEFYGEYDEDNDAYSENGVYEDNNELAEWARVVVPELFETIATMIERVNEQ